MHDMWHIGCMSNNKLPAAQVDARHSLFVLSYIESGNVAAASEAAGLSSVRGFQLLHTPHIAAAIQVATRQAIVRGAPMAFRRLAKIIEVGTDRDAVAAAKTVLAIAGHVAPRAAAERGADIPLHEMSLADLRGLSSDLQGELASRATPINTNDAPQPDSDVDIIG